MQFRKTKKQPLPVTLATSLFGKKKAKTSRKKKVGVAVAVGSAVATGVSALTKPKKGDRP